MKQRRRTDVCGRRWIDDRNYKRDSIKSELLHLLGAVVATVGFVVISYFYSIL